MTQVQTKEQNHFWVIADCEGFAGSLALAAASAGASGEQTLRAR